MSNEWGPPTDPGAPANPPPDDEASWSDRAFSRMAQETQQPDAAPPAAPQVQPPPPPPQPAVAPPVAPPAPPAPSTWDHYAAPSPTSAYEPFPAAPVAAAAPPTVAEPEPPPAAPAEPEPPAAAPEPPSPEAAVVADALGFPHTPGPAGYDRSRAEGTAQFAPSPFAPGPTAGDAPITITGAPAPSIPLPQVPPPVPSMWGPPPAPVGTRSSSTATRWNWAAGAVVGLAAISLAVAAPQFAAAMKFDRIGDAATEDWLLWGSGALGLLALSALVTKVPAVVSILAATCTAAGTAAFVMANDIWEAGSPVTWSALGFIGAYLLPGLCATFGLRQT